MGDGLQDLNLRFALGGGTGCHVIDREGTTLDLLDGMNFMHEDYVDSTQPRRRAGRRGVEVKACARDSRPVERDGSREAAF